MPCRSLKVNDLKSADGSKLSARSGIGSNFSFLRVSPLKINWRIRSSAESELTRGSNVETRFSSIITSSLAEPVRLHETDRAKTRTISGKTKRRAGKKRLPEIFIEVESKGVGGYLPGVGVANAFSRASRSLASRLASSSRVYCSNNVCCSGVNSSATNLRVSKRMVLY